MQLNFKFNKQEIKLKINNYNKMDYYQVEPKGTNPIQFALSVFQKRKVLIIAVFFSVLALVTVTSILKTPVYKANSKILVEREMDSEKSLLFRMNLNNGFDSYDWLKSEVEILLSTPVAMRVIDSLKLYNSSLNTFNDEELNRALYLFASNLTIERPKDSNVIDIIYESEDKAQTARVVNELVEAYMDYRFQLFSESGDYQFLNKQITLAEEKLNGLEQRLSQFKQAQEITSPDAQRNILLSKIADYEKALTTVRTKRISKETLLIIVKEQMASGADVNIPVTETSDSPSREKYITKLRGELLDLELQRSKLLQKYTPEYEEVVNLGKAIASIRVHIENEIKQIVESENTAIRALNAEEQVLTGTIRNLNGQIKHLAKKEYELNQLSRGISDNREVYSMLMKQREEARISQAKLERGVKIKVISPALTPTKPFSPQKKRNLFLGVIVGLITAFGLALLLEHFEVSPRKSEEVKQTSDLPVWGAISTIKVGPTMSNWEKIL